jgi:hypothetical protein
MGKMSRYNRPYAGRPWIGLIPLVLPLLALAGGSRENITAFVGATLIDGTGGVPRANAVILVAGERIAAVGNRDEIAIPPEARMIDARGKWIVPGLIDAHIHFFQSGGLYAQPDILDLRKARPYADEIAWIKQRIPLTLARYVASGVTSVADPRDPGELVQHDLQALASMVHFGPRRGDLLRSGAGQVSFRQAQGVRRQRPARNPCSDTIAADNRVSDNVGGVSLRHPAASQGLMGGSALRKVSAYCSIRICLS